MFSLDDSIVSIATPPGRGGIGIVRVSGPRAQDIAGRLLLLRTPLRPRLVTYSHLRTTAGGRDACGDEVLATLFVAPHSYTGQDVVEISAHGSPVVLKGIVSCALDAGARLAEPGEFTLRAFLNGKRDLVQAEAVADLIEASTPLQAQVAFDQLQGTLTARIAEIDRQLFEVVARLEASLDFPDEGYHFMDSAEIGVRIDEIMRCLEALVADGRRGRTIREGATVVIAGRTNVGKSSLFNALMGSDRAIVSERAGTTRDLVTERLELEGLVVTLVDTAGWRQAEDFVEREGVARSEGARAVADLVVIVVDLSEPLTEEDEQLLRQTASHRRLVVANKCDLLSQGPAIAEKPAARVSAKTGEGLWELRRLIASALSGGTANRDAVAISNLRHLSLLREAGNALQAVRSAVARGGVPEEVLLVDLHAARGRLGEIVGAKTSEDVLRHIFERFCIGK